MEVLILFVIGTIIFGVIVVRIRLGIERLGHRNDARQAVKYAEKFGFSTPADRERGIKAFNGRLPQPGKSRRPSVRERAVVMARSKELDSPFSDHLRHADKKFRKHGRWAVLRALGADVPERKVRRAHAWRSRIDAILDLIESDRHTHPLTRESARIDKKTGRNLPGVRKSDRPHVHLVPHSRNPDTRRKKSNGGSKASRDSAEKKVSRRWFS